MEPSEIHIESIHLNSPERDDDDDHKSSDLEDGNNNSIQGRSFTDTFSSLHIDQLNTQDVNQLLQTQRQILLKLDTTNKNVDKTNHHSTQMFTNYGAKDFQSYISTLHQMKLDLEFIFKRIRTIKTKLEQKYPQYYSDALALVKSTINPSDFEDDEEIEPAVDTNKRAFDSELKNTRATSNVSNESTASSRISDFINTARERINSTGLVSGLLTPTPTDKPEDTVQ